MTATALQALKDVMSALPQGLLLVDARTRVLAANRPACRLLAPHLCEAALSLRLRDLLVPLQGDLPELLAACRRTMLTVVFSCAPGSRILRFYATLVRHDATPQPGSELYLLRCDADDERAPPATEERQHFGDAFLAKISHDLRTPLQAVLGWTAVMQRETRAAELRRAVEAIRRNAELQARTVEDLLASLSRDDTTPGRRHADVDRSGSGSGAIRTVDLRSAVPPRLDGISILLVDDHSDSRIAIGRMLAAHGADVTGAGSSADALQALARGLPDIVISDLGMPVEDGFAFLHKLRDLGGEAARSVPAVALTAYADPEHRDRAFAAGFDRFVVKPVDPLELVELLEGVSRSRG